MNFAEIDNDDDNDAKVKMMNTYDRLLRLRSILEFEEHHVEKHTLYDSVESLKKEYIDLVTEVLIGYMNLESKKEKASQMLSILDKLGNKDVKYVDLLSQVIDQFDQDEQITESAEKLEEKTRKMLSIRNVFSLCKEADVMSSYMCFVCLERPVNVFLDPCGHVICQTCSDRISIRVCPFCRSPVRQCQKMFLG